MRWTPLGHYQTLTSTCPSRKLSSLESQPRKLAVGNWSKGGRYTGTCCRAYLTPRWINVLLCWLLYSVTFAHICWCNSWPKWSNSCWQNASKWAASSDLLISASNSWRDAITCYAKRMWYDYVTVLQCLLFAVFELSRIRRHNGTCNLWLKVLRYVTPSWWKC